MPSRRLMVVSQDFSYIRCVDNALTYEARRSVQRLRRAGWSHQGLGSKTYVTRFQDRPEKAGPWAVSGPFVVSLVI